MCRFPASLRLGVVLAMFRTLCLVSSRVPARNINILRRPVAFVSTPGFTQRLTTRRVSSGIQIQYFSATAASDDVPVDAATDFFAPPDQTFESIGVSSPFLLSRLEAELNLTRPSAVQAASYEAIAEGSDVTIGAETGSGKTFAYLLPLLDDILKRKQTGDDVGYDYARAIILVPNKELVQQVVRMAVQLCGSNASVHGAAPSPLRQEAPSSNVDEQDLIRLAVMPGGLNEPTDFQPFRQSIGLGGSNPPVDIVISTPAAIGPLALKPKHIDFFADVETLVIDEADMLLDGGYIRPLENVLMGFRRADRLDSSLGVKKTQHVFVAATLPDMGLRSVDAYLQKKFPYATQVTMAGMHNARHYGLKDQTVWIEEGEGGNKERMEKLVEMLQTPREDGGLLGEKVMVFLNSVDDVDGASGALRCVSFCGVDC